MKKIKNIIIIVILLIVWLILISIFFKEKVQLDLEKKPQYIIIHDVLFFEYKHNNWNFLEHDDRKIFDWKEFNVYVNNKFDGIYNYVFSNGKSYYYDGDNSVKINSLNSVLVNENSFVSVIDYNNNDITDEDNHIIYEFLKKNDIDYDSVTFKLKYNISNGGDIYIITNYYDDIELEKVYYIVFYRKDNKNYLIANQDYNRNYDLSVVFDVNRDFNTFLLSYDCVYTTCYDMYQYVDSEYRNVFSDME